MSQNACFNTCHIIHKNMDVCCTPLDTYHVHLLTHIATLHAHCIDSTCCSKLHRPRLLTKGPERSATGFRFHLVRCKRWELPVASSSSAHHDFHGGFLYIIFTISHSHMGWCTKLDAEVCYIIGCSYIWHPNGYSFQIDLPRVAPQDNMHGSATLPFHDNCVYIYIYINIIW